MAAQVFFNRPARPIDLNLLWRDMRQTKDHLVLASAWFTDTITAGVFIDSVAERKTVIFNAADIDRGTKKAYELIKSYFINPVQWDDDGGDYSVFSSVGADDKYGVGDRWTDPEDARFRFIVLGSGDWTEGVMHHKFILCDSVVWVGSFNFTYQARKNYETILRVDDQTVVRQFYGEVDDLLSDSELFYYSDSSVNGAFRCTSCSKLFAIGDMGDMVSSKNPYEGEMPICKLCFTKKAARAA